MKVKFDVCDRDWLSTSVGERKKERKKFVNAHIFRWKSLKLLLLF